MYRCPRECLLSLGRCSEYNIGAGAGGNAAEGDRPRPAHERTSPMKRCAFFLAIAAVLAVPAGASAFFRCWCAPRFGYGYGYGAGYAYGYGYGRFGGYSPYFYPAYPAYPYFAAPYYVNPVPITPVAVPSAAPQAAKAEAPVAPPRAPIVTITPGESVKPAPKTEVEQVRGAVTPIA